MATTMTGTISCVQVFDDGCFIQIVNAATGEKQAFTAWFAPPEVTAFERIMHSMWVSLFRESLTRNLSLTINTGTNNLVTTVQLGDIQ
jgi:hypothetical protein